MNGRPFFPIFLNLSWNYLDCNCCVLFLGLLYFNTTKIYQQYLKNFWSSVVSRDPADVLLTALVKLFCMLKPPCMRNVASLEFLHLCTPRGSIFISVVKSYIFIGLRLYLFESAFKLSKCSKGLTFKMCHSQLNWTRDWNMEWDI